MISRFKKIDLCIFALSILQIDASHQKLTLMELNALTAISPIDGRYGSKTSELRPYFSEFGLIKYRVIIEVEYLIALVNSGVEPLADFPKDKFDALRLICTNFSVR